MHRARAAAARPARFQPQAPLATSPVPGCACGGGCTRCNAADAAIGARAVVRAGEFAPPSVTEITRAPGQPLDAHTRRRFERTLGHDLGRARLHAGRDAAHAARSVGALAFTAGRHVVLGDGWRPGTAAGDRLLAHELTHVVQQGGQDVAPGTLLRVGAPGSALEQEADRVSSAMTHAGARTAGHGPAVPMVQRRVAPMVQRVDSKPDCDNEQLRRPTPYTFWFVLTDDVFFSAFLFRPAKGVFKGDLWGKQKRVGLGTGTLVLSLFECDFFESIADDEATVPSDGKRHRFEFTDLDEHSDYYFSVAKLSSPSEVEGGGSFN